MKFIAEVEETTVTLRKVIIEANTKEEAEKIIYDSIDSAETVEELHSSLNTNKDVIVREIDYKGEEFEVSYFDEYEKYIENQFEINE